MFNEENGAERCVRTVSGVLATVPHNGSLIVVNDGSVDSTGQILAAVQSTYPGLEVVSHATNRGYGAALRSGVERARDRNLDYVLFMDSDLTNDPGDIPRFYALMVQGFDLIKATRYSLGGSVTGVPWKRVVISRIGNAIARGLIGMPVHDCTNGFRAMRTELAARMRLHEERFPIIMEELYWSKWLASTVAEVPVTLSNRRRDQRPTSFVYRPSVLFRYLKYPLLAFLGRAPEKGLLPLVRAQLPSEE